METAREPESCQLFIDPASHDDFHAMLDSLSYEFDSFLHRKEQVQKRRDDEDSSQTCLRQEEDAALIATGFANDLTLAATRKAQDDQKAQARLEEDTELERIRANIRGRLVRCIRNVGKISDVESSLDCLNLILKHR